jgi:flagellin FlaB
VDKKKINTLSTFQINKQLVRFSKNKKEKKQQMKKVNGFFKGLHRIQKGITGLETAIILIAFVTVASVLAYSVLSAGIFSSEKGKESVYSGLEQASASMEVRGSVLALSTDGVLVDTAQFTLASVLQDAGVDMTDTSGGLNSLVINYTDSNGMNETNIDWTAALVGAERGVATMLDASEQMVLSVTLPTTNTLAGYDVFTLQIIPPKGAAITIERTLPGAIATTMDLH